MRRLLAKLILILFTILIISSCTTLSQLSNTDLPGEKVGEIEKGILSWNWFFSNRQQELRQVLENQLLQEARALYGPEAFLQNLRVSVGWDPRSLLMFLNLAGYVQKYSLKADIFLPPPPSAQEAEIIVLPPPPEYHWVILPEPLLRDSLGYVQILYNPEEVTFERLSGGKKIQQLARGGTILITLGRTKNEQANTRNFEYSLRSPRSEEAIKVRGMDLIPNVPGRDGLWWNEDTLHVMEFIENELTLEIYDRINGSSYGFIIKRVKNN